MTRQLQQAASGLVAETGFAKSVQPVPFHIVKGVFVHLLTPDLRESEKIRLFAPLLSSVAAWRLPLWAANPGITRLQS